ncbi:NUDIX domain-containing protein [Brucella tritici]|uniref:NUDIX domain-containing protein n=1 Tax=Brucella tritici TaxID=94626 RepID=A0A833CHG5_9HYPH|nr:NUDIX domain-containing protein [Brucella tritici]KAB2661162.1 NUDIX domain-containing protein [Brucella tritici]
MNLEYVAKYGPGPHVAVDAVVISLDFQILLIRRKDTGKLALPGGFVEPWEYPIAAAWRELREEAGLSCLQHAKRVKVYDDPKRDPRAHIITHAHLFMLAGKAHRFKIKAGDDAKEAMWVPLSELFMVERDWYADHMQIIMDML